MRIRQVKPEFWRDEKLSDLTDSERLIYIGLWMCADDAGWFRMNLAELGADLFPYEDRSAREQRILDACIRLTDLGRVAANDHCNKHSWLPHLAKHQRMSSPEKRVFTVEREHRANCIPPHIPAETRGDADTPRVSPTRNGTERKGTERKGTGGAGGEIEYEYEEGKLRRKNG